MRCDLVVDGGVSEDQDDGGEDELQQQDEDTDTQEVQVAMAIRVTGCLVKLIFKNLGG